MDTSAGPAWAGARRWLPAGRVIPRGLAAVGLRAGGGLVFLATFLPLGRAVYPATGGDAAVTILSIPARDLVTIWGFNLRQPDAGIISTSIETLLLWGPPAALVGIGV